MPAKLCNVKRNSLLQLFVECLWRGLGDPGSVLNQQLMLDNRFTRISQYFGENDGVEYYSAYSHKDCLNGFVYKDKNR